MQWNKLHRCSAENDICNTPFEIEPANLLCIVPNLTTWTIFQETLHQFYFSWTNKKKEKKTASSRCWDMFGTSSERLWHVFGTSLARLWNVVGTFEERPDTDVACLWVSVTFRHGSACNVPQDAYSPSILFNRFNPIYRLTFPDT